MDQKLGTFMLAFACAASLGCTTAEAQEASFAFLQGQALALEHAAKDGELEAKDLAPGHGLQDGKHLGGRSAQEKLRIQALEEFENKFFRQGLADGQVAGRRRAETEARQEIRSQASQQGKQEGESDAEAAGLELEKQDQAGWLRGVWEAEQMINRPDHPGNPSPSTLGWELGLRQGYQEAEVKSRQDYKLGQQSVHQDKELRPSSFFTPLTFISLVTSISFVESPPIQDPTLSKMSQPNFKYGRKSSDQIPRFKGPQGNYSKEEIEDFQKGYESLYRKTYREHWAVYFQLYDQNYQQAFQEALSHPDHLEDARAWANEKKYLVQDHQIKWPETTPEFIKKDFRKYGGLYASHYAEGWIQGESHEFENQFQALLKEYLNDAWYRDLVAKARSKHFESRRQHWQQHHYDLARLQARNQRLENAKESARIEAKVTAFTCLYYGYDPDAEAEEIELCQSIWRQFYPNQAHWDGSTGLQTLRFEQGQKDVKKL